MNLCGEANLDAQYLTSIAQNIPTETWWYDDAITNMFNGFIIQMANSSDPPLVVSMSYAWYEAVYTSEQLNQWNIEAMKLGIQGVTILAAAGDAGVAGPHGGFDGAAYCGYGPLFLLHLLTLQLLVVHKVIQIKFRLNAILEGLYVSPMPFNTSGIAIDDFYFGGGSVIISGTYNPRGRGYPDVSSWSSYVWVNVNLTVSAFRHERSNTSIRSYGITNKFSQFLRVVSDRWVFLIHFADSFAT